MAPVCALGTAGTFALAVCAGLGACSRDMAAKGGRVSEMQADRYIERAVGQSNEGVVLLPSQAAEREFDRVRMAEIAQNMRRPLAVCFLERAIITMERKEVDGDASFAHVPQGQAKMRARLNSSGEVLRVEVLDSAFEDPQMEACVQGVIERTHFPESRNQTPQWVDVVYWVSLGLYQDAQTPALAQRLRREQAMAARRGSSCLEGRVEPGTYAVEGLSLFDREGGTLVNRVERGSLDPDVSRCVAQAFKAIRIPPEGEAFVRPATPQVVFEVREDGDVTFADARWLELLELEERALREARKAKNTAAEEEPGPIDVEADAVSGLVPGLDEAPGLDAEQQGPRREPPARESSPPVKDTTSKPPAKTPVPQKPPGQSPGRSGIKLDLDSRGDGPSR